MISLPTFILRDGDVLKSDENGKPYANSINKKGEEMTIKYSCYGRPNICMRCKVEQSEEEFHAGNFCSKCAPKVNKMWAKHRLSHQRKMQECYDFENGKDLEK